MTALRKKIHTGRIPGTRQELEERIRYFDGESSRWRRKPSHARISGNAIPRFKRSLREDDASIHIPRCAIKVPWLCRTATRTLPSSVASQSLTR